VTDKSVTDKKVIVQRGLWFEEFETGVLYQHRPGRTITEADNVLSTTLTMNTQALHLDAAFSDAFAAVQPAAGEFDVHVLDAGQFVGGAADAGHDRGQSRLR
jgi:hypothetical protein